ncbi:MAG TPA: zinc ribbon domain-containing protein [Pyrinomonadaceae bacterium]
MSEPEIARRCLSCGASVRQRAAFCPQCGQQLDNQDSEENREPDLHLAPSTTVDEPQVKDPDNDRSLTPGTPTITEPVIVRRRDETGNQTQADEVKTRPLVKSPQGFETQPLIAKDGIHTASNTPPRPTVRPAGARRAVFEDQVLGRVEKLRKVSSVVIDQAAYDPSMRFLLVAALLFVIFIVLMVLSKVIG